MEARELCKTFADASGAEVRAVDHLSLTITQGEVVALLGPNGAGKPTSVDMMLGLTRPDAGTLEVFGGAPLAAARSGRVSAMTQDGGLLPDLSVAETMAMIGALIDRSRVPTWMRRANLSGIADRQVSKCSGGERQRLRLGLALLPDPDLLILDEPTAGLGVEARRAFWAEVRADARSGRTIIFATHYLDEVDDFADRVVLVNRGVIVADGSAAVIRAAASGRLVSARLPAAAEASLLGEPGVTLVERRCGRVALHHQDSDRLAGRVLALGGAELEGFQRAWTRRSSL